MPDGALTDEGPARHRAGIRWLVLLTCVVVLVDIAAGVLTLVADHKTSHARRAVTAGFNYAQSTSNLMQDALDAETAQRGYMLTGEYSYLGPVPAAVKSGEAALRAIKQGSRRDPVLRRDNARLRTLIDARVKDLETTLKLYHSGKKAAALAIVKTNRGNRLTQQLRVLTAAMIKRSNMLVNRARTTSRHGQTIASIAAIVAYLASGVLLVMLVSLIRRYLLSEQGRRASRIAQIEAERLNVAKTGFLSRVSHELRTPLNAILGFGQLLEREALNTDQRETLDQMLAGGRHLLAIVDDLLDLSRVETGELRLSLEPVQVTEAVGQVRTMMAGAAVASAVGIRLRDIDGTLYVRADRQRLVQVLLNLLSNAIKYNRRGGNVVIGAERVDEDRVRVTVTDTGSGIAAKDIPQLFTAFERLDAAGRGIEGTGLGLAVSRGLVEAMGGTLELTSRVGVGTTVTVELPRSSTAELEIMPPPELPKIGAPLGAEEPADSLNGRAAGASAETHANGEAKQRRADPTTVLYIEDNPSNVQLVEKIFALRPEITLSIARDGGTGLASARELHPSVVLLDLHLPDMPGQQVLAALLGDPVTADIPVIIVSADASPIQAKRLQAAGAKGYLTKPFEVDRLFEAVRLRGTPAALTDSATLEDGLLDPSVVSSLHALAANPAVGPAQIGEMLVAFRHDAEAMMATLRDALAAGDMDAVAREAHRLAGGSGAFGAGRFRAACREVEENARGGRVEAARSFNLDTLLAQTLDELQEEFADELQQASPPPEVI